MTLRMWILSALSCLARSQSQIPEPVLFEPSGEWDGNDGPWSSFGLVVGSPNQTVRVLPASLLGEVYLVPLTGCPTGTQANCSQERGGLFQSNKSSTYVSNSISDAISEAYLIGYEIEAKYGFDTVNSADVETEAASNAHVVIAEVDDTDFWLGLLGLSPYPSNFTTLNSSQSSLFQGLQSQSRIASRTWSYTAGAVNHDVLGSLIFGGFDSSRLDASTTITLKMKSDVSQPLLIPISGVYQTSDRVTKNRNASSGVFYAQLDSSSAYLWLPYNVCLAFEAAFGIVWDPITELYLVNETLHNTLVSNNISVTFEIDDYANFTLSYAAFDLVASYPLVNTSSNTSQRYFPVKRAANESQYTMGRTFLQETYVTADFDRQTFNISKAILNPAAAQVYSLEPPTAATTNSTSATNSTGAVIVIGHHHGSWYGVGIALGAAAGLAILAYFVYAWRKRRPPFTKRAHATKRQQPDEEGKPELDGNATQLAEAASADIVEMPVDKTVYEAPNATKFRRHEMLATVPRYELSG